MGDTGTSIVDLISEVQKEAAALRNKSGPTTVPIERPQSEALAAMTVGGAPKFSAGSAPSIVSSRLYNNAHPAEAELHSHRGQIGRVIIFFKKFFRQMMRPALDRQASFNQALIQSLETLTAQHRSMQESLAYLENKIRILRRDNGLAEESSSALDFNYKAFQERYRGSSEQVREMQSCYQDYFALPADGPVLDLGCGRGEFLTLLQEKSIPCYGVDLDDEAVKVAQGRGLQVEKRDLLEALEDSIENSLGGIVSFQVVEHLPLRTITRLLIRAKQKLRPGGILILETVNIASLYTHANAFTMDPTHNLALHPLTLQFMAEDAQFSDINIIYGEEVPSEDQLETSGLPLEISKNFHRLNSLLFAPQNYAIVARA
jgi:2-polyprenyl-3-methyl-5-hydroxy-6-metoxy-1,4-benzoquinol methylase